MACLVNEFTKGLYNGFAYGASKICDFSYPTFKVGEITYTMSHADPYFYITQNQLYLTYALVIFLIGKSMERVWFSQMISFIPLILCLFFFGKIEDIKNLDINNQEKYIDLIRDTVNYGRTFFFLIVALIVLQIGVTSSSIYKKYKDYRSKKTFQ